MPPPEEYGFPPHNICSKVLNVIRNLFCCIANKPRKCAKNVFFSFFRQRSREGGGIYLYRQKQIIISNKFNLLVTMKDNIKSNNSIKKFCPLYGHRGGPPSYATDCRLTDRSFLLDHQQRNVGLQI